MTENQKPRFNFASMLKPDAKAQPNSAPAAITAAAIKAKWAKAIAAQNARLGQ